jgi:N-acetylneuraminic acid mutarotase
MVQRKVYIGGGSVGSGSKDDYVVMEYDIASRKWAKLPPYRARHFAMAVTDNQLVLVGGQEDNGLRSKKLGVWKNEWVHSYPDMPTPRSESSAVVYKCWLMVAGGSANGKKLSSVEVLNTDDKQWYTVSPTPTPWIGMNTAIVGETCYFMGGITKSSGATKKVYSLSLPALLSQLHGSKERDKPPQLWKEIHELPVKLSIPLSTNESLLAVGGIDANDKASTATLFYQPNTVTDGEWVEVGDFPTPRHGGTYTMIKDSEILVAGGRNENNGYIKRSDITLINAL